MATKKEKLPLKERVLNAKKVYCNTDIEIIDNVVTISHIGNDGESMNEINKNLKRMGDFNIKEIKTNFKFKENGTPEYLYKIEFTI